MERMPIAIMGCGGMGRRHPTGLAELYRSSFCNVELVAVCDVNRQNAEDLADEAVQQLGRRPAVFAEVQDMVRAVPELQGADVVTDAGPHHVVASACLEAGLHVLCEKPLALTMRGCNRVVETARRTGRILSVAENYRRDPINRLACALIQGGAIGTPQLLLEITIGGGNRLMITPWRHHKASGTAILDIGVHLADIAQYYLGDAVSAYGEARLYEPYRYKTDDGGPGGFYAKWAAQMPDAVTATGEDALFAHTPARRRLRGGSMTWAVEGHQAGLLQAPQPAAGVGGSNGGCGVGRPGVCHPVCRREAGAPEGVVTGPRKLMVQQIA